MNSEINFKRILILFVIIVGTAGAFFAISWIGTSDIVNTPTTKQILKDTITAPPVQIDPLASWKMYRNEKYGFELKYNESSMPNFVVDEVSFNQDQYFPGAKVISFFRATSDPLFLESGAKTFPAFSVVVLPIALETEYASICKRQTGSESEPLMMSCPPLRVDARNKKYVFYFNNFNQDPPKDVLTEEEKETIRTTLLAF